MSHTIIRAPDGTPLRLLTGGRDLPLGTRHPAALAEAAAEATGVDDPAASDLRTPRELARAVRRYGQILRDLAVPVSAGPLWRPVTRDDVTTAHGVEVLVAAVREVWGDAAARLQMEALDDGA